MLTLSFSPITRSNLQDAPFSSPPKRRINNELAGQFADVFGQFDKENLDRIAVRDLSALIDRFEAEQDITLFGQDEKQAVDEFSAENPDLEVSADEILSLIARVQHQNAERALLSPGTAAAGAQTRLQGIKTDLNSLGSHNLDIPRSKSNPPSPNTSIRGPRRSSSAEILTSSNIANTQPLHNSQNLSIIDFFTPGTVIAHSTPEKNTPASKDRSHLPRRFRRSMTMSPDSDYTSYSFDDGNPLLEESELSPNSSFDGSISSKADELSRMQRKQMDLTKKYKDAQLSAAASAEQLENQLAAVQEELDNVRAELQAKRKELVETKSKELADQQQIATLEGEMTRVQKSLDTQRAAHANIKRKYEDQATEMEALRDKVLARERDLRIADDNKTSYRAEAAKWALEREQFEQSIAKLETEVQQANDTHQLLEEQRLENSSLTDTVTRLRFEMEEMKQGSVRSRLLSMPETTVGSPATLSTELDDDSDEVVEAVTRTARRRRKHGALDQVFPQSLEIGLQSSPDVRTTAVQSDLGHERIDSVPSHIGKAELISSYETISKNIGMKCTAMHELIKSKDSTTETLETKSPTSLRSVPTKWKIHLESMYKTLESPLSFHATVIFYTFLIWGLGFIAAAFLLPVDTDYGRYHSKDWRTYAAIHRSYKERQNDPSSLMGLIYCYLKIGVEFILYGPMPMGLPYKC